MKVIICESIAPIAKWNIVGDIAYVNPLYLAEFNEEYGLNIA